MQSQPRPTKKVTASERAFELENMVDDMDYNAKEALVNLHIMPDEFDEADYYRLNEVLAALPRKERRQDPEAWLKSLGL